MANRRPTISSSSGDRKATILALRKLGESNAAQRRAALQALKKQLAGEADNGEQAPPTEHSIQRRFPASLPTHTDEDAAKHLEGLKAERRLRKLYFPDGMVEGGRITGSPALQTRNVIGRIRIEQPEGARFEDLGLFFSLEGDALLLVARIPKTPFSLRPESADQPGDLNSRLRDLGQRTEDAS